MWNIITTKLDYYKNNLLLLFIIFPPFFIWMESDFTDRFDFME